MKTIETNDMKASKRTIFILFACLLLASCSENKTAKTQSNSVVSASTPIQPASKEEQLISLLSDEIIDSVNGEAEKGENLIKIENLIKQGVDVNTRDKSTYQTPLHLAAQNGRPTALRMLLKAGVDTNAQDKTGLTPLMVAAGLNDLQMVKVLLENGAKAKIEDNQGNTALSRSEYPDGGKGLEDPERLRYLEIRRLLKAAKN